MNIYQKEFWSRFISLSLCRRCRRVNKRLSAEVNGPICIAGSINSYEQVNLIKSCSPWAFTIGSGF